jgi:hypothetical protein
LLESDGSLHLKGFAFRLNAAETLKIKEKNLILKMKKGGIQINFCIKAYRVKHRCVLNIFIKVVSRHVVKRILQELNQQLTFQFHIQFIFEDAGTGEEIITNSKPLKVKAYRVKHRCVLNIFIKVVSRHVVKRILQNERLLFSKIDLNAVYKELNQQLTFQFHIQFIFEDAGTGEEMVYMFRFQNL